MKRIFEKLNMLFFAFFIVAFCMPTYCIWGQNDNGIYWVNDDGTIAINGWRLIDEDKDGMGYYYYFDEKGFILMDDITPDMKIVRKDGKRIDYDGEPICEKVPITAYESEYVEKREYSAEIMEQIRLEQDVANNSAGLVSSGMSLYLKDPSEIDGPRPSDGLIIETNPDGTAKYLLGPNVVLKKDKKDAIHDPTMDKKMVNYIKSGDKYSKKVNGTTFTKQKWKEVMALKGTGASIVFENPKNNFNKLKGRIATHYFTYTDRTTQCTLYIYNEDDGEELFQTSDFNYNSGAAFECVFPKKSSGVRFELEVDGQYTSRVCYLRNCEFGFDREEYDQELYDDEVEAEYRRRVGTESEAEYEEEDEDELGLGEIPREGEDPVTRYRRIHGIVENDDEYWANFQYDEDDESITDAMKASISEAKRKLAEEDEKRNAVSGPAFDPKLKDLKPNVGPDGSVNIIAGFEGE